MENRSEYFEVEVLATRRYKAGYEVRTERVTNLADGEAVTMKTAYTPNGDYIGDSKWAHRLIVTWDIIPALLPGHRVCSVGFCPAEQKHYGWSHRAICGFGIGDRVDSADHLCSTSGWTDDYLAEHPDADMSLPVGFEAKTMDDCKRMAHAFAEAVG